MKVAYFTGLRKIEVRNEPNPILDRPDGVLLRIDVLGVCGSDVHYYTEGGIGDQILHYPTTLGHECSGTVIEVGRDVRHLAAGDRVAVDPAFACGQCDQCRAGRVHTCRQLRFMGSPGEAPGAAAQFRVVPAENCVRIPALMSLDEAMLAEPLSIGLHAVRLAGLQAGQRRAIFGCGPIGLSVLLCGNATAPGPTLMTDRIASRLEVARYCGAAWTGQVGQEDVDRAIVDQYPEGLDVIFECSGDPACIDQGMRLLAPGGLLVLVGIPSVRRVDFDTHVMRRKELTFKNVRRQNGCVAPVIELIQTGQIDPGPLITHHRPLDKIQEAFELVAGYREGVIKAAVVME